MKDTLRIYNPTNSWSQKKKIFFTGFASAKRNNPGDVTVIRQLKNFRLLTSDYTITN